MDQESIEKYLTLGTDWLIYTLPRVAVAIIALLIGFRIINKLVALAARGMKRAGLAENILPFISSLIGILFKVILLLVIVGTLGFDTAGFVAMLAAAGFAIGLALQGSLANFASGILILIFQPYRVGDWIKLGEAFGRVTEIQIFNTLILTPGNKTVIIPNGQVTNEIVTNLSRAGNVRLELEITMPYSEDFPRVRDIILAELTHVTHVLPEPLPLVGIERYDSHNVVIGIKPFIDPNRYWEATYAINARLKAAFSANGIKMAYSEGVELGTIGG